MKTSVTSQFRIGAAIILVIFCAITSIFAYFKLKEQAEQSVFKKTEIYLSAASSIRSYVKDVLRPKTMGLIKKNNFVVEAMSTSYISRNIMNKLKTEFPEFYYKRAAGNPRNPVNLANSFEVERINWFNQNPTKKQWMGMIRRDKKRFYARLKPILVEKDCLQCHGDPVDAPKELIRLYGTNASFGYRIGDVVAADTIYIPMDKITSENRNKAIFIFIIGTSSLFLLLGLFFLLFNKTITIQLKEILSKFSFITGEEKINLGVNSNTDEFEQLKLTFNKTTENIKTIHEELKASEIKYRRLFKSSPFAIFISDKYGHITDMNDASIQLFRFESYEEAFETESFHQLFFDIKDAIVVFDKVKENGWIELTSSLVNRIGNIIDVVISASRIHDEKENFYGFECIIRDITESKRLNKYLAQTEKLASIGQLAAGVAHEINNPLGVIKCYSNLIKKSIDTDSQIASDIKVIQRQTEACKSVVESLLNFARVSDSDMEKNGIHECIDEIFKVIKQQILQGISIEKNYSDEVEPFVFDINKIKQVLINLFLNATQAMPDGGKLVVKTEHKDDKIFIKVSDTGSGISKGNIDRIFEPFFTTKETGTGLGLSVSYGIIQQHNGELKVNSVIGEGTEFIMELPYRFS